MKGAPTLTFLGGTGTVTGSKYLLEVNGTKLLVDCGLFQGKKALRERNWSPLPFEPSQLDAVLLTHAHLDHSGYLPVLYNRGFSGPVVCSSGTAALARILLPDSGYLQEEDAEYANRKGYSRHRPAKPLYTQAEAASSLRLFRTVDFGDAISLSEDITATFQPAGHILGAASIEVRVNELRVVFSGDIGRPDDVLMKSPVPPLRADYLIVESTYGDRLHDRRPPQDALEAIVNKTAERGGIIMVPAFAVGRAQAVMHLLSKARADGQIPDVPVYLNSPMAINATGIFCDHEQEHRLTRQQCNDMCEIAHYVNSADESRALNKQKGPMIVISASGMGTGGRIVHHFKAWLGDERNTVLFTGFQAAGTRGAALAGGARSIRIHNQLYQVRAEVSILTGLSAHADQTEILEWMGLAVSNGLRGAFITHGEPVASESLQRRLSHELGIRASIPTNGERFELT